ncbi:NADH:flavin oxidoreductase/NADH oxidase [Peniophora sp. CONT]|nr:NADH:flavin oxidoreductase/NADH oxidase [Peniophora sp. CONT]
MGILWSSPSPEKLFSPIKVGNAKLEHRVVLAPLTRRRADDVHVHTDLAIEYYKQRSSTPGTLLITEATFIAPQAGGYTTVPGVWNEAQVAAWKKIVDAVHANGSTIFLQLWALGRGADAEVLQKEGPYDVVSASDIPIPDRPDRPVPRPLTVDEIKEYVQWYAQAAKNAVEGAGFDGVEIHSANGYLLDQFIQTNSNVRTDEYGGSIENRIRFPLEVVKAVTDAVSPARTAIRFSPWSPFQGMRLDDPIPTFTALIEQLVEHYPNLAYVHVVEPRISGNNDTPDGGAEDSNDFIRKLWAPRPLMLAGGFKRDTALKAASQDADKQNVLVAFGRYFISNPDLPKRLKANVELTHYDRSTFYTSGPHGYTDYPFYDGKI